MLSPPVDRYQDISRLCALLSEFGLSCGFHARLRSWGGISESLGAFQTKPGRRGFPNFFLTAESFGVSAQIGSGVVRAAFHQGSTRVPPGFHEGCGVVRALKRAPHAVGDIT